MAWMTGKATLGSGVAGQQQQGREQGGAGDRAAGDAQQVGHAGEAPVLLRHPERHAADQQRDGAAGQEPERVEQPAARIGQPARQRRRHRRQRPVQRHVDQDAVQRPQPPRRPEPRREGHPVPGRFGRRRAWPFRFVRGALRGHGGTPIAQPPLLKKAVARIRADGTPIVTSLPAPTAAVTPWPIPVCLGVAALAVLLSAALVRMMIRLAVMDVPGDRSAHARPTPKGGGVGMVAAVLLGTPALLALLPGSASRWPAAVPLLAAVLLLATVSWLDDLRQFGYRGKLGAQLAAAALVVVAALASARTLPSWPLLGPGMVVALGWLMLTTNATNFIDGLNGLAAGSTTIVCLAGVGLGWWLGDPLLAAVMMMTAAGLLGFLPFNYPQARIFLGDVGSQPAGLLMGGLALVVVVDGGGWAATLVPLMLTGILWDVLLTLGRRAIAGERLAQAHRGHLYQRAARTVLSAPAVSAMHWSFAVWGLLAGLLSLRWPVASVLLVALPQVPWTMRAWR